MDFVIVGIVLVLIMGLGLWWGNRDN